MSARDIAPFEVTLVPEDMPHVRRAFYRDGRRWLVVLVAIAAAGLAAALASRFATPSEKAELGTAATINAGAAVLAALVVAGPLWLRRWFAKKRGWRSLTSLAPLNQPVSYRFDAEGMRVKARGLETLARWDELQGHREGRRLLLVWGPKGAVYPISTRFLDRELSGRLREVMEDHRVPAR